MTAFGNIGDDRPAWARGAGWPSAATLAYAQALATTTAMGVLAAYLLGRAIRQPGAITRAAHKATGA